MTDVVRDSVYHITFSNAYTQDPYFIPPTAEPQRQEKFGWWSEINFGATMWGMQCQPGSVVAAHERVRSAHCINVNARVGEDVIIKDKLPASALCETGHAVGGWFNLQGAKKVYRLGVGPGPSQEEQVSLRLNCRYVPGLSRLCETKDGNCDQDEIVTGLEFENATFMKYRCCKMPRTFGQTFVPGEGLEGIKVWEGYYCPERLDVSGRPEYQLDQYTGATAVDSTGTGFLWDSSRIKGWQEPISCCQHLSTATKASCPLFVFPARYRFQFRL